MNNNGHSIWGTLDPFFEPGPILGRKVANQGFLDALLRVDPFDGYHFFLSDKTTRQTLGNYLQRVYPQILPKLALFPRTALASQLATTRYHCFHLSDCLTSQGYLAALRNRVSQYIFPITGVTHTLSYARYGSAFAQHIWAGVTPRDCIVATSQAGQRAVHEELMHLSRVIQGKIPQTRIIPLGVWCDNFAVTPTAVADLPDQKIIFLVLGRISPYSKMDLLPLLRGFQRLGQQGVDLGQFCLVLAGSTDESLAWSGALYNLAANIGLQLMVIKAPQEETKNAVLHRADVVISLADNPQETFGLTVLEAAAAGKPIIVSDYSGYRDLVIHNQTGIRVLTIDGGIEDLVSLMAPLLYDSIYHLWLAQDVAVDVGDLAQALTRMLDPGMRKSMGERARTRARQLYDWPGIIQKYCALWTELNNEPVPEQEARTIHPLAMDYATIFQGYAGERLQHSHIVHTTALGWAIYKKQNFPIIYAGIEECIDLELMRCILVWARKSISWEELYAHRPGGAMRRTTMWMLKNDFLGICR